MAEAAVDGVRLEGWQRDLRLELALLRLAGGDAAGAAPLLTAGKPDAAAPAGAISRDYDTPPGGWSPYSRPHQISGGVDTAQQARLRWNWFQLLEAWRQPSPEDPFELLIEGLASSSSSYGRRFAAAELARRERYPAVAAFLEDLTAVDLRSELERGVTFVSAPPPLDSRVIGIGRRKWADLYQPPGRERRGRAVLRRTEPGTSLAV
jgi:hypothetical protein